MKIAEHVFLGTEAAEKKRQILRKLKEKKIQPGVYLICPASSETELLDLIPAWTLYRFAGPDLRIVGLAGSKQEAFEVCGMITEEVYAATGDFRVRDYCLQCMQYRDLT